MDSNEGLFRVDTSAINASILKTVAPFFDKETQPSDSEKNDKEALNAPEDASTEPYPFFLISK